MTSAFEPDAEDLARIVLARASSRLAITEAWETFSDEALVAFRVELATCVSRISAFALSLVETEGLSVDALVGLMEPGPGWPFRPMAHRRATFGGYALRHVAATGRAASHRPAADCFKCHLGRLSFNLHSGGRVRLYVADHSIEVVGRVGPTGIETSHGTLRLQVPGPMSRRLREASVGALASDVVDMPALRGRDWRVSAVESRLPSPGWALVVQVGSRPFRMPWARPP